VDRSGLEALKAKSKDEMTEYSLLAGSEDVTSNMQGYEIDWKSSAANKILYSRQYMIVYFAGLLLSLFLLVYDIMDHPNFRRHEKEPLWFIVLDILCVLFLVAEVSMRYSANPLTFWSDPLSCIDPFVIILSVISLALYSIWTGSDYFGSSVLGIRYVAVSCRLCFFLKRGNDRGRAQSVAANTEIIIDGDHTIEPTWGDSEKHVNQFYHKTYLFQGASLDPNNVSQSTGLDEDSISTNVVLM